MFIKKYLESLPTFDLEKYDTRKNIYQHCISFIGLRYQPFEVSEPIKYFKDSGVLKQTLGDI